MEREEVAGHPKKGAHTHARIGFSDESAFSDKPMVRKTWAPKGKTPILKVPGGWITRSVVSLITCSPKGERPRLYFKRLSGTMNAERFLDFLKQVKCHMGGRKLILIIDNLRVHKAKAVKEYVEKQRCWLAVEYLPPYAPELNPTEYVWSSGKRKDFGNATMHGGRELDRRIRECGERTRRSVTLLKGFLKASTLFT